MTEPPTPEQVSLWQRRLASQANNRAWTLSELSSRSREEDDEMLEAANAAMYFWSIVGNANNRAHAALLLAHAYALLGQGDAAKRYFAKAQPFFFGEEADSGDRAIGHAVAANIAAASGEREAHASHYAEAARLIAALPGEQDRAILGATLRVIPAPSK
jgi:hypothetical protein